MLRHGGDPLQVAAVGVSHTRRHRTAARASRILLLPPAIGCRRSRTGVNWFGAAGTPCGHLKRGGAGGRVVQGSAGGQGRRAVGGCRRLAPSDRRPLAFLEILIVKAADIIIPITCVV